MTIVQELYEKVKRGASAYEEEDEREQTIRMNDAVEACKIILKEDYLGMYGWPEKPERNEQPAQKKIYTSSKNDKGHKMQARRESKCVVCETMISVGDNIYWKKGTGATHEGCVV